MKIELNIPGMTFSRLVSPSPIADVRINREKGDPWIEVAGERRPLWVLERASRLPPHLDEAVPPGWVGLIIGRSIPDAERRVIESSSMSWWDLNGGIHLDLGTRLIHIDAEQSPSTTRARADRRLGPVGTRAAQQLLVDPRDKRWSVTDLAQMAGVSSGQAHNVLRRLEEEGIVDAVGQGPSKRRVVRDSGALLDWLRESESLLKPPRGIYTYLYARNEIELARRVDQAMREAGLRYALTAALGSRLWGVPVVTSVITQIRVASSDMLSVQRALSLPALNADEAGRGANLELWPDTGGVGTHGAVDIDGLLVAPAARVYLDLVRLGGRFADGAELLRETVLD